MMLLDEYLNYLQEDEEAEEKQEVDKAEEEKDEVDDDEDDDDEDEVEEGKASFVTRWAKKYKKLSKGKKRAITAGGLAGVGAGGFYAAKKEDK